MGFLHLVDPFLSCRVSAPHERTQCALSFFTDKSPWSLHQVDPMIVLVTPPGKHVTFDTQEDEENAKTLCILGNYGIALDQHRAVIQPISFILLPLLLFLLFFPLFT